MDGALILADPAYEDAQPAGVPTATRLLSSCKSSVRHCRSPTCISEAFGLSFVFYNSARLLRLW